MPGNIKIIVTNQKQNDKETYLPCCSHESGFPDKKDATRCAFDYLSKCRDPMVFQATIYEQDGTGPWFVYRVDKGRLPNTNFIPVREGKEASKQGGGRDDD